MRYMIRKRLNGKAHYWNGTNTLCKMYATGGMNQKKYMLSDSRKGLDICTMCNNNALKIYGLTLSINENR